MLAALDYYYPHFLMLAFLAVLSRSPLRSKGSFFLHAMVPLVLATVLVHLNRWFEIWPAHRYFASGHMTFCLGITFSMARLRPWSLAITLPLLALEGIGLVAFHFHTLSDVLGAILIVPAVYWLVERSWPLERALADNPTRQAAVRPRGSGGRIAL
jgi:membrane-associated phospholipid phosphatase